MDEQRYDAEARYVREYWRRVDEEAEQREWEEEQRREKLLRGEPFFITGNPDLYRDMRRGK